MLRARLILVVCDSVSADLSGGAVNVADAALILLVG